MLSMRASICYSLPGEGRRTHSWTVSGLTPTEIMDRWGDTINGIRVFDGTVSSVCGPITVVEPLQPAA